MKKNLVVIAAGENSLHTEWFNQSSNFDIVVLYYGNCDKKFSEYEKLSKKIIKSKGQKWHLITKYLLENLSELENYDYFWFPDDDLLTNVNDINKIFEVSKQYDLWLCQPSLSGYVSYEIEKKVIGSMLRFTNFVEIICPLMSNDTLKKLLFYLNINESGWGLDYLWPKLLGYPVDKIAILDSITVEHTKPIGGDYKKRYKKEPIEELKEVFQKYGLTFNQQTYSIVKT